MSSANLSQRDGPNVLLDQEETRRQEPVADSVPATLFPHAADEMRAGAADFSF
jgi:hypothetical protein